MKKEVLFVIAIIYGSLVFSQTTETERLLQNAFETVASNPDESLSVASYLLKSSEYSDKKSEAHLLNALANYTKGRYDDALTHAFRARHLSKGNHDKDVFSKSSAIIASILESLQLHDAAKRFRLDAQHSKKSSYITKNDRIEPLLTQADLYFAQKQNDSSIVVLQSALQFAKEIDNPFLQQAIHQRLSANFLTLGDKEKFNIHNQDVLILRNATSSMENRASNTAHQLINQEADSYLEHTQQHLATLLWAAFGILILFIILKVVLTLRNRSKLKTYKTLFNYLNQKPVEAENPIPIAPLETSVEIKRDSTILKESENQILNGLKDFEQSMLFVNKDMSLGLLAAELNTNTKYLSTIINRHKKKNFNTYINELRIHYITEKLKTDPTFLNYKVSYLAEACGFGYHSTFTTVFKSVVGVSPITFVDFVKNGLQEQDDQ